MNELDKTIKQQLNEIDVDVIEKYIEERKNPVCRFKKNNLVLVRDNPAQDWQPSIFISYNAGRKLPFQCIGNIWVHATYADNHKYEWTGGDCPAPGRSGVVWFAKSIQYSANLEVFRWTHKGRNDDITGFMLYPECSDEN